MAMTTKHSKHQSPFLPRIEIRQQTCFLKTKSSKIKARAPRAKPEIDTISGKVTIISVSVGGYSFPIAGCLIAKPLTLYIAIVAILTAVLATIKRKTIYSCAKNSACHTVRE